MTHGTRFRREIGVSIEAKLTVTLSVIIFRSVSRIVVSRVEAASPHFGELPTERIMTEKFRVFATCDIGESLELLHKRGYDVEVYPNPEAPPKGLILEKVKSGIDGLITTLRDPIDAEVFEAGKGHLKVVAQFAVGFDNINRADANRYKIPFTHTADVLTEATAEFSFFMMGILARRMWAAERHRRQGPERRQ